MKYLKVWTDFREVMKPLQLSEKGSLFDAMLNYAETGEEPEKFEGNERFVWPVAKRDIDNAAERAEKLRQNGSAGGKAKANNRKQMLANDSKSYQTLANDSNENQTEAKDSRKEKKRNEMKRNEMKSSSFLGDDEADTIQGNHDRVLDAAEDAGFKMSNTVRAALISLYSEHGLDKMLAGFNECVRHGAVNLAYLEAVLKGKSKTKAPLKVLPAQQYEQRDYSGVNDELSAQQDKEMEEWLKAGGNDQ